MLSNPQIQSSTPQKKESKNTRGHMGELGKGWEMEMGEWKWENV